MLRCNDAQHLGFSLGYERCSGGKAGVAFDNMVSAMWRDGPDQVRASLMRCVVVDRYQTMLRSHEVRYACMKCMAVDVRQQRYTVSAVSMAFDSMHGCLMCIQNTSILLLILSAPLPTSVPLLDREVQDNSQRSASRRAVGLQY